MVGPVGDSNETNFTFAPGRRIPGRMKNLLAASLLAILAGCGIAPVSVEQPVAMPFMNYRIGRTTASPAGAPILLWTGNVTSLPAFRLTQPIHVEHIGEQPPGQDSIWLALYAYHGDCAGGRYVVVNPAFYNQQIGIVIDEHGAPPCPRSVVQVSGANVGRVFQAPEVAGVQVFEPAEPVVVGPAYGRPLTWEIVYDGRTGNNAQFTYREYSPAPMGGQPVMTHTEQLSFDLRRSRRVSIHQVDVDVVDATASNITFRVVRDEAAEQQRAMEQQAERQSDGEQHAQPPAHGGGAAQPEGASPPEEPPHRYGGGTRTYY